MKTKVKNKIGYQVPTIFQEEEVVVQYLAQCGLKRPKTHIGKLYYIVNRLRIDGHLQQFRYKNKQGWVSMSSELMKTLFGDHKYYNLIMENLIRDGFVECNCSYFTGNKSKPGFTLGYRLTEILQTDNWNVIDIKATKCSTTSKILAWTQKNWTSVDKQLYNKLTQFHIEDIPFFDETTINNFQSYKDPILDAIKEGIKPKDQSTLNARYSFYKDCYLAIKAGEWRYKPDRFGRRHNNLTNLPKILRDNYLYVLVKGKKRKLSSVDIRNSQPLLTVTLLKPEMEEYKLYKELAESGYFYDFLAREHYREEKRDNFIKPEFFLYLYGDPERSYVQGGLFFQIMYDQFGEIHSHFNVLKATKGHKFPAQQMQKIESEIMINNVCKKGIKLKKVFAQIYDSILCLEEDIESFDKLIKEAFHSINLEVQTKIKNN